MSCFAQWQHVRFLKEKVASGLPDKELEACCNRIDKQKEALGKLPAETLHDVEIVLSVLCDRLRANLEPEYRGSMSDLFLAQAARDDLRRIP